MNPLGSTTFTRGGLRQIAVRVAEALRNHPEIQSGVSVRATLSFLEILEAMRMIDGTISIQAIYDSAFSAFGGRLRTKGWRVAEDILQEVLDEILIRKKPDAMEFSPKSFGEDAIRNIQNLLQDLMTLSIPHDYGLPHNEKAKVGIYPSDLLNHFGSGRNSLDEHFNLPALTGALQNTANQSWQTGTSSPLAATMAFLKNLEKLNLMKQDSTLGGRYNFTRGAVNLIGEKTANDILQNHYEELVDSDSGEVGESMSKEELTIFLKELQSLLDLMQIYRAGTSIDTLMRQYNEHFPTISKTLGKWAPIVASHSKNPWEKSSGLSEAFRAILSALIKERYMDDNAEDLPTLSTRGYDLVFKDILPEVQRLIGVRVKGEHVALVGSGNEGEIIDIRRYRQGDRFHDIAIGATFKEMVKNRRRQPEIGDLRTNQLLPRQSLDIVVAIDSSRSMGQHGKLLYAKKAAIGLALAAVRRGDRIGVLAFSDYAKSLTGLTGNVNQRFLGHVTNLRPLNTTNIEDALKMAAKSLCQEQTDGQKHIILITDGIPTSCLGLFNPYNNSLHAYHNGAYFRRVSMKAAYAQAKHCLAREITISTICIDRGEHVNREFCRTLSRLGKGRVYFLKDERKLLQTTLKEYYTYVNSFIG